MDEPGWQWPAWKFGMKREELFTTLQDQYNTIPSLIQDPEAFHHDVYEISNTANTNDEFHRLLADRKEQRIRELNESLESASLEIISNPSLIGTTQWQHAVQLFRTKSLDSLVRYFASYLPEDHPWHHPDSSASWDEPNDSVPTSIMGNNSFGPLTHEPLSISTSMEKSHFPPSPRSMTQCSDESSAVSSMDDLAHHDYDLNTLTPARSLSFSEPETDIMVLSGTLSMDHDDDETSQLDEPDTPTTSVSDLSETRSLPDCSSRDEAYGEHVRPAVLDGFEEDVGREDADEEVTPTPRNESTSDSYMARQNSKPSATKFGAGLSSPLYTHVLEEYVRSSRRHRREGSPGLSGRSPENGRIQKHLPDPLRIRAMGRRRD